MDPDNPIRSSDGTFSLADEQKLEDAKRKLKSASYGGTALRAIGRADIDEELRRGGFRGIDYATAEQIEAARLKVVLGPAGAADTDMGAGDGFERMFDQHDKDHTGLLDFEQFRRAMRIAGKITPKQLSDEDLRAVFDRVDVDRNGGISASELHEFVYSAPSQRLIDRKKTEAKFDEVRGGFSLVAAEVRALDAREVSALWSRWDWNNNAKLSLAEVDKALSSHPPDGWEGLDAKRPIALAFKTADSDWSGYVRKPEFDLLLRCVVYFHVLWDMFEASDVDGDRRLELWEFKRCATPPIFPPARSSLD